MSIQSIIAQALAGFNWRIAKPLQYRLGPGRGVMTAARLIGSGADGITGGAGHWGISGGDLAYETSDVRREGKRVIKASATATTGATDMTIRKKVSVADLLSGRIELFFKLPKAAGLTGLYVSWSAVTPALDPPVTAPSGRRQVYVAPFERTDGIWTALSVHPAFNYFGTGSSATGRAWFSTEALPASIQYIDIFVQFDAGVPADARFILIDQVGINGRDRPSVVFMFDGWYQTHKDWLLPQFAARGFRGSSGSASRNPANHLQSKLAITDALYAGGWDITSQGQRGGDAAPGGYGTNTSTMAADIASCRADLIAAGYTRGLDIMSYAYNSRGPNADAVAKANGMRMARAGGSSGLTRSQLGSGELLGVGCTQTDSRTGAQMIAALDAAIAKGEHVVFFGHDVVDKAAGALTSIETSQAEMIVFLDALASRVAAGKCVVRTPSEFLAAVSP